MYPLKVHVAVETDGVGPNLPDEIVGWIEAETRACVTRAWQVPGGNSREAWFIDLSGDSAPREAFLRYDRRPIDHTGIFWPLPVEAKIFQALYGRGVTVPKILAVHPALQAVLAERVPGETWFYRITDPAEQVLVAQDFIRNLAALHRIDARTLDLPELGPLRSVADHVRADLTAIRERATGPDGSIDPLIEVSLTWLSDNVPSYDGPPVLVQGDTGPGNFLYQDGRVTAVVDWELAHFGDPMDDIAWLSLRTVQDTFTHFPDRLTEYEQLTGIDIDESRVWYYRLLAEVRLAGQPNGIGTRKLADVARAGGDAGNSLIYGILHRRLLLEAFARAASFVLSPTDHASLGDGPNADALDAVAETLRTVVDRAGDALAVARAKAAARLIRYAKAVDADGTVLAAAEHAELVGLLGHDPGTIEEARAEVAAATQAGLVAPQSYVIYRWHQVVREDFLARDASGSLRRRTWPPLR